MIRASGAALALLAMLGFAGVATSSPAVEPSSYVPGELLVRFASSTPAAARADALADLDATVVERLSLGGLVRVRLEPGTSVPDAAEAFERRSGVRYAQPNHRFRLTLDSNDPRFLDNSLWGLSKIDAPGAWDTRTDSSAVTVAVVDSGIDYTHPELVDNMWQNDDPAGGGDNDGNGYVDDLYGWNFTTDTSDPADDNDHGTHVAGTIGARGNNGLEITGVNWRVKLMALKAGTADGMLEESWIAEAFQYACANGARVINGSFGGYGGIPQAMFDAINACPNSLFVFAASNEGNNNDVNPAYPCSLPAPNIVCVAATMPNDTLASFSNYGAGQVDLAAPGTDILSSVPVNDYATWNGTSMAAPHVAGAAALVLAERPTLTTAELRRSLLLAADAKPTLTGLVTTGARLNVRRALSQEIVPPAGLVAQSSSQSLNSWSNVSSATVSWGGAATGSTSARATGPATGATPSISARSWSTPSRRRGRRCRARAIELESRPPIGRSRSTG